jgi:hypothetical protein
MKNLLAATILFLSLNSFAQSAEFGKLDQEGEFSSYKTSSGITIKSGDKLKIGYAWNRSRFTYITQATEGMAASFSETIVEIQKIKVVKLSNGFLKALATFKGFGLVPVIIDIEPAIKTEEIIIQ